MDSFSLTADCLQIWIINHSNQSWEDVSFGNVLSAEEKQRANRYKFKSDYLKYVHSKYALRRLLGSYTHHDPRNIPILIGATGKPYINFASPHNIKFSVSHTPFITIIGFSLGNEIGVDIEFIKPIDNMETIFRTCFSEDENKNLEGLIGLEKLKHFFSCWTMMEAYQKAIGDGITGVKDGGFSCKLEKNWVMGEINLGPGYCGHFVVEKNYPSYKCAYYLFK